MISALVHEPERVVSRCQRCPGTTGLCTVQAFVLSAFAIFSLQRSQWQSLENRSTRANTPVDTSLTLRLGTPRSSLYSLIGAIAHLPVHGDSNTTDDGHYICLLQHRQGQDVRWLQCNDSFVTLIHDPTLWLLSHESNLVLWMYCSLVETSNTSRTLTRSGTADASLLSFNNSATVTG